MGIGARLALEDDAHRLAHVVTPRKGAHRDTGAKANRRAFAAKGRWQRGRKGWVTERLGRVIGLV
ncbi:MAG: hypothetical protein AcusKO_19080 [Acuticoccus sp.]